MSLSERPEELLVIQAADAARRTLGVAVVGTGWGCLTHVPALRAAGFHPKTLVGTNEARTRSRAEASGIADYATDLAAVLDDPSIDAVVLATPPETHMGLVLDVVSAGKHVFCEKPFATSDEEAVRMRDAATAAGVVHMVGHEFRWLPQVSTMSRGIRDGAIGAPRMFTHIRVSSVLAGRSASAPEWFEQTGKFGGWTNAEVQHLIDEVRISIGEFAWVSASEGQVTEHDWDAAETFTVHFGTVDGAMGVIQSSVGVLGPRLNVQRVSGTQGSIWLSDDGAVIVVDERGQRPLDLPTDSPESSMSDIVVPSEVTRQVGHSNSLSGALSASTRFIRPTVLAHRAFRDRIEGREAEAWPPVPTFADGVANTGVHTAIRRSIETGHTQWLAGGPRES